MVSIQNWDAQANRPERRSLHDLATWRDELESLEDVGGFRQVARNLIAVGAQPEVVRVAEITASGFRVARVPPLAGRHLLDADEKAGAPPVVVIGHEVWRTRFAGDPGILGRTLQLGAVTHSIVGVMPEGFAFPVSHRFWVPLRAEPSRHGPRQGPEIFAFGRLAPGATLADAQSELARIGQRTAAALPRTHAQLRPQVLPYAHPFLDLDDPENVWTLRLLQLLVILLLVVVAVNVAILVYARTATRQGEIAVRSALGASRNRIVAQLFAEALVLSAAAAAAGLALATAALRQVETALSQMGLALPFWMSFDLSPGAVAYVLTLAVLAAAIVGVLPAVKATGHRVEAGLRSLGAGGSGMQLGRTWTVLIVVQVAFAVALLPPAVFHTWSSVRYGIAEPGFAAEEFLTARLTMDQVAPDVGAEAGEREPSSRYRDGHAGLVRHLQAEPGVSGVTFARACPARSPRPGSRPPAWSIRRTPEPGPAATRQGPDPGQATRCGSAAWTSISSPPSRSRSSPAAPSSRETRAPRRGR